MEPRFGIGSRCCVSRSALPGDEGEGCEGPARSTAAGVSERGPTRRSWRTARRSSLAPIAIVCSIAPRPSTSSRTTSPAARNCGGSIDWPTPSGVPVRMRSPGSSVHVSAMKSTSACGPKTRSAVLESWRSSPLTCELMRSASGSATSSAVVIQGPQGQEASKPLARVHCGLAALEVAGGEVVGDRVAGDARRRRRGRRRARPRSRGACRRRRGPRRCRWARRSSAAAS